MGFFSFITQDTNRSISNIDSCRGSFSVTMTDNKGNKWHEERYEGYGEFGGKDFFELLAEMNGKITREEGIDIYYGNKPFISPNLTESKDSKWKNEKPENCAEQGFFYDDDQEDDYEICPNCGEELDYFNGCPCCDSEEDDY